jgi:hypothetical protein
MFSIGGVLLKGTARGRCNALPSIEAGGVEIAHLFFTIVLCSAEGKKGPREKRLSQG